MDGNLFLQGKDKMRSIDFWDNRYAIGGTSGVGSTGNLLNFKINFINDFIKNNDIKTVLDFGHGDCSLAKEIIVDTYLGIDGAKSINRDIDGFQSVNKYLTCSRFDVLSTDIEKYIKNVNIDMTMCIDVLYHILDDEIEYLEKTLHNLYCSSSKYIMIYAQDSELEGAYKHYSDPSVNRSTHMYNCPWKQLLRTKYFNDLKLIYEQELPQPGCDAKFYIYEKVS